MELILGSQSPRRLEIMNFFTLAFHQVSPLFDEESVIFKGNPETYVQNIAKGKADSLIQAFSSKLILTADTVVYMEGKIYGKPKNKNQGLQYIEELSGQWHSVWTGLVAYFQGQYYYAQEETRVLFNVLTDKQKQLYGKMSPFTDKAGGYMIQGAGSLIVKRIEGCYYNVMGLPVNALSRVLFPTGIDLWEYLKGSE